MKARHYHIERYMGNIPDDFFTDQLTEKGRVVNYKKYKLERLFPEGWVEESSCWFEDLLEESYIDVMRSFNYDDNLSLRDLLDFEYIHKNTYVFKCRFTEREPNDKGYKKELKQFNSRIELYEFLELPIEEPKDVDVQIEDTKIEDDGTIESSIESSLKRINRDIKATTESMKRASENTMNMMNRNVEIVLLNEKIERRNLIKRNKVLDKNWRRK